MAWKAETRNAFLICLLAAIVAIPVSLMTAPESRAPIVVLPFAAFCLIHAVLVAVNRPWAGRVLTLLPAAVVACGLILWLGLGLAQVPELTVTVVVLCWALVLLLLNRYCRQANGAGAARWGP